METVVRLCVFNFVEWGAVMCKMGNERVYLSAVTQDSLRQLAQIASRIGHLLIRGLLKGMKSDLYYFHTFSMDVHYYIVHSDD